MALRLSAMKLHLKELVEMSGELHRPTDFSHGFKREKVGLFPGFNVQHSAPLIIIQLAEISGVIHPRRRVSNDAQLC